MRNLLFVRGTKAATVITSRKGSSYTVESGLLDKEAISRLASRVPQVIQYICVK